MPRTPPPARAVALGLAARLDAVPPARRIPAICLLAVIAGLALHTAAVVGAVAATPIAVLVAATLAVRALLHGITIRPLHEEGDPR